MTVFHPETTGNHAQLDKAKTFIEMSRVNIAGNNSIKLQDAEAMEFSLNKTVGDQFLSDMKSPCPVSYTHLGTGLQYGSH